MVSFNPDFANKNLAIRTRVVADSIKAFIEKYFQVMTQVKKRKIFTLRGVNLEENIINKFLRLTTSPNNWNSADIEELLTNFILISNCLKEIIDDKKSTNDEHFVNIVFQGDFGSDFRILLHEMLAFCKFRDEQIV